ncbi:RHS repeat-associated core domain-containing protein [Apibacter sp. HY039]|uniref:RHS repeat-associated core domain-containing protein n=1 Tax=Apibacter sp. HY039 TaxID=2501476 RepID=UPI00272A0A70|nr:RHS repeat-associated core domain-containing protein [Apibacter sp. HY039]
MKKPILQREKLSQSEQPSYTYKYNGKELQEELGLNVYDYGARNYDPAIGRWFTTDPLAEMFPGRSPYEYVFSNPVNLIDPTGMGPERADDIIIRRKDTSYRYVGSGKVQTKVNGKWKNYDGEINDEFVSGTIKDLDKISSTSKGKELVNDLINVNTETTIKQVDNDPNKSWHNSETNEVGFDREIKGLIDGVQTTPEITLGHELYHAWDHLISQQGLTGSRHELESEATHFENYLRSSFGKPLRKNYTGNSIRAKSKDYYLKNYTLPFKKGTKFIIPEGKCKGCDNIAIPPRVGIIPNIPSKIKIKN